MYILWAVLHRTNPPSPSYLQHVHLQVYYQSRYFDSGRPGLINDILQEINSCNPDDVVFSLDLRRRCETAAQHWSTRSGRCKVLVKQHEDLNLKNHVRFLDCLYQGASTVALLDAILVFASTFFDVDPNSLLVPLLILFPSFVSVLAIKTSSANSYAGKVVS
ncbi:uncharacterized protein ARMOST_14665 [Armillaria ostoyae]|uniref:Uncharacterized protein n=1 Tax=Armillaria ostoyae TaxID=47428 RepID=A0A284RR58_ARMOS|nr:uncharacterized protein ARMOST_14665 [Armillaria ostoyae]